MKHEPPRYRCPFCQIVAGQDLAKEYTRQTDVVLRSDMVTAFISLHWWPGNPGHVIVVPNLHYENVYDIPDDLLASVQVAGKRLAMAIRATYECEGTSFRQHNEPTGGQDVWHYHLHVFPRFAGDNLYLRTLEARITSPAERLPYAEKLRQYLGSRRQG